MDHICDSLNSVEAGIDKRLHDGRQNISIAEILMKDKRKANEEKLDAQLKEWNAQIALLKAKAENAKAGREDRLLQNHRGIGAQTE